MKSADVWLSGNQAGANKMKFRSQAWAKWVGVAVLATASNFAMAAPIVTNGGFEDAQVTPPWTFTPAVTERNTSAGANTIGSFSGQYSGSDNSAGSFAQNVTLLGSHSYNLRFFVRRESDDANTPAVGALPTLAVSVGANPLTFGAPEDFDDVGGAGDIWWRYNADLPSLLDGVQELLFSFAGRGTAYLDEVNIVDRGCANGSTAPNCGNGSNVPEPGSLFLVGAALAGLGLIRRRKFL